MSNDLIETGSLSIWDNLMLMLPCKDKAYVIKWLSKSNVYKKAVLKKTNREYVLRFYSDAFTLAVVIVEHTFKRLFKKTLETIVSLENMRNKHELCIWLDMKQQCIALQ